MRAREINTIIQEQTEEFFKQEGFKYVKKDMAYVKKTDAYRIEHGFVYYEYHPLKFCQWLTKTHRNKNLLISKIY